MEDFDILSVSNLGILRDYIYDEVDDKLPEIKGIYNLDKGVEIIAKHINNESFIVGLGDVDCDGMMATYVLKKTLERTKAGSKAMYTVNKKRTHGVQLDMIKTLNNLNVDLLIILDSSSEMGEVIKEFNGDVVVIDHHEVDITKYEIEGETKGGQFVVVNNMIKGAPEQDETTKDMSGAMVAYKVMKELAYKYNVLGEHSDYKFDKLQLENCVAVSLYTDVIPLRNHRNQHFINTIINKNTGIEVGLAQMFKSINVYLIDKTRINFNFAPFINGAVRCGHSREALSCVIENFSEICDLEVYKREQDKIVKEILEENKQRVFDDVVLMDITDKNLEEAFNGLLASKLRSKYNKCAYVYCKDKEGNSKGSFRGLYGNVDYRKAFIEHGGVAKGHKGAFGLQLKKEIAGKALTEVCAMKSDSNNIFLTYGNATGGIYHIDDLRQFKRQANLIHLAHINARSTGTEEINIIYSGPVQLIEEAEKYRRYKVGEFECIAFEEIRTEKVCIYVEFCSGEIKYYVNNIE